MEKLVKLLDDFNRDLSPFAGEAKYTIWDDSVELAKYLIDNDVRQIGRAYWIPMKQRPVGGRHLWYCSNCGQHGDSEFTYCPGCVSKMASNEEALMKTQDRYEVTRLQNIMYEVEEYVDGSVDALIDTLDNIVDIYDEGSQVYRELSMIEDKLKNAGRLLDKELD